MIFLLNDLKSQQ